MNSPAIDGMTEMRDAEAKRRLAAGERITVAMPWRCPFRLTGRSIFAQLQRHGSFVPPSEHFIYRLHEAAVLTARQDPALLFMDELQVEGPEGVVRLPVDLRNTQFIAADRSIGVYPDGYEADVMAAIDLLIGDEDGFVDAGANWGYFSLYLATRPGFRGRINAFEPAARPRSDLERLVKALELDKRITCHSMALSDHTGEALLSMPAWSGAASLIGTETGERVAVGRLDDLALGPVRLMKLDVEGAEAALLRGAGGLMQRDAPDVIFECRLDTPGDGWRDVFALLGAAGYRFYALAAEPTSTLADSALLEGRRLTLHPVTAQTRPALPLHLNVLASRNSVPPEGVVQPWRLIMPQITAGQSDDPVDNRDPLPVPESDMANPNSPSRYPVAEKVSLYVSQLEDELRHYKGVAEFYQNRDANEEVSVSVGKLASELQALRQQLAHHNTNAAYQSWFATTFGKDMPVPNTWPFTTFKQGTPWCDKVVYGMQDGEILYAEHLLETLENEGIVGDIVEFGTYFGHWVQVICETLEKRGWNRRVWGFDSFEGLPTPKEGLDPDCWTEGMYSAPFDEVKARLLVDKRTYLQLVKGWFNKTLFEAPAIGIEKIAYARIDGDLYESCVDCLKYLDGRLVDGAVLVFDDWQFSTDIGEPRAFKEWLDAGANKRYRFEYLDFNMWAHLYVRVRKL